MQPNLSTGSRDGIRPVGTHFSVYHKSSFILYLKNWGSGQGCLANPVILVKDKIQFKLRVCEALIIL